MPEVIGQPEEVQRADRFDRVARLAAQLLDVPIALLTLIEGGTVRVRGHFGWDGVMEMPVEAGPCGLALSGKLEVITDAESDPRWASHPFVADEPRIRFFAEYPIHSPDRHIVGTLSLFDVCPRQFTEEAGGVLRDLAALAESEYEHGQLAFAYQKLQSTQYALRRSEQRFRDIAAASGEFVWELDLEGRFVFLSDRVVDVLGYGPHELLGVRLFDLMTADEGMKLRRLMEEANELRAPVRRVEYRLFGHDGEPRWLLGSAIPVADDNGKTTGMRGVSSDVTARRVVEAELKKAKEAAELASQAKSDFLANMSHEIRTPMNAIVGLTNLMLETELTPEQADYIQTVRQSTDALLGIINDILDFSKIESGKLEIERVAFSLRLVIEEVCDYVAHKAAEKSIEVAYWLDPGIPSTVVGDVTRVRQILANLVSNAVKFTEKGQVVVEVAEIQFPLEETEAGTWIQFTVRDTGIGIPADKIGYLFESFSQVDASTTRRFGGTGLGLAISKRLATLMGGDIRAESVEREGSSFQVVLPLEPAEAAKPKFDPALRGATLLLVAENSEVRRMIKAFAGLWEMKVAEANGAQAARDLVNRAQHFDVALVDFALEGSNGIDLIQDVRQHRRSQKAQLILMASIISHARLVKDLPADVAACLPKPIHFEQCHDVFAQAVTGKKVSKKLFHSTGRLDPMLGKRQPLTILLAEDNAVNQKVAVHLLSNMGYRPDVAQTGAEVIRSLERQSYDLILMDVQMPELDGLEATRLIRRRFPQDRQPYIVAMTANAMPGDAEKCINAGMNGYISKPVRVEQLQEEISKCGSAKKQVIDERALEQFQALRIPGEPDPLLDLIEIFLTDTPKTVEVLLHSVQRRDVRAIARHAHTLKGSSGNFGARALQRVCANLEEAARHSDLSAIEELLSALRLEHEQVCRYLEKRRQEIEAEEKTVGSS
jgi:PAS domain S-box-containing protein